MRISNNIWQPILVIGSINMVLLIAMLLMATTIMANPAGVTLSITNEKSLNRQDVVDIKITAENVIYLNDKVMTINELRRYLATPQSRLSRITIRADQKASAGRVLSVLNLCQGIAFGEVHVTSLN